MVSCVLSKGQFQYPRQRLRSAQGLKKPPAAVGEALEAGGGNRTHDNSLEDCSFTIKLRPQGSRSWFTRNKTIAPQPDKVNPRPIILRSLRQDPPGEIGEGPDLYLESQALQLDLCCVNLPEELLSDPLCHLRMTCLAILLSLAVCLSCCG